MTSLEFEILQNVFSFFPFFKRERKKGGGQERNVDGLLFASLKKLLTTGLSVRHVNSPLFQCTLFVLSILCSYDVGRLTVRMEKQLMLEIMLWLLSFSWHFLVFSESFALSSGLYTVCLFQ